MNKRDKKILLLAYLTIYDDVDDERAKLYVLSRINSLAKELIDDILFKKEGGE